VEEVAAKAPEVYFDAGRERYLVEDAEGRWLNLSEKSARLHLRGAGLSDRPVKKGELSPIEECLLAFQRERNVDWAGEIAGYAAGVREMCGARVLVTKGPRIPEPVEGNWDTLRALIEAVLGCDGGVQVTHFLGWLKVGYEALRAGTFQPGQAVALCGPHGCGKSFLQHVVTAVLGGRSGRPHQLMSGGTGFNADLLRAEHLVLEDEQPSTDIRARRAFGSALKAIVANETQRLHAKHRDAIPVRALWRLTISLNDEPENLLVLPPVDESIADKVMLFRCRKTELPMPTSTGAEQAAFRARVEAEVPAMLAELLGWDVPADMRSERYGVKHYHQPDILATLNEMAPEFRLLALLDAVLFAPGVCGPVPGTPRDEYAWTAEALESALTSTYSGCEHEARRLLSWSGACGTYLGRLARKRPDRVVSARTATSRAWRILREGATDAAEGRRQA